MLQHLNTLIGFAAVFAILSLLVTSVTQVIRTIGKLKTRTLIERLLRLFGELRDPERFVAAILAHPSLEGERGRKHYEALTNPSLDGSAVRGHVVSVLGRGGAAWRLGWVLPWVRTNDLDKQAVKDIGQSVYEAIGRLVDRPIPEAGSGSEASQRWAHALKQSLDRDDADRLRALSVRDGQQGTPPSRGPQLPSAVAPFRGRMWMLAASAFPEAEGKAPPLKTYVAAFHDEAQASASDSFTWKIRWVTVVVSVLLALVLRLDAVAVWDRAARADAAATANLVRDANALKDQIAKTSSTADTTTAIENIAREASVAAATGLLPTPSDREPSPIGFLLAIAALSLGAPFWFEVLKSAIQMKSAFTKEKE